MKRKRFIVFILIIFLFVGIYLPNSKRIIIDNKSYNSSNEIDKVSVEIGEVKNGMFTVTIKNVSSSINSVEVPVWTVYKGQDDLVWYNAIKQSDGSYRANVYLKNHNMETGEYSIHVYLKRNNNMIGPRGFSKIVDKISVGDLKIDKINNDSQVKFTLFDSDYHYYKIRFAVWSEVNGQDDIVWYDANNANSSNNVSTISIRNHNSFGKYNVHVYAFDDKERPKYLFSREFNIDAPKLVQPIDFKYNSVNDDIDIKIKFDNSQNITKLQVPIWSTSNGQDDLIWYDAKPSSDGTWSVHTNLSKHSYFIGDYNIHFYVTTSNGIFSYVGSSMERIIPSFRVEASVNKDKTGFNINYSNYAKLKGYDIKYAVWSEANGQDDLIWYDAKNGKVLGTFSDHMNKNGIVDGGKYNVHFYIFKNGVPYYVEATSFEENSPKATYVEANQVGENIEVYIRNVSSSVKSIELPTWSVANGQDDLIWYNKPTNLGGGNWKFVVKLKDHNFVAGEYVIHVYLKYSNRTQIIGSGCNVSINKGSVSAIPNPNQTSARVTLTDSVFNSQNIKFAVWSDAKGHDDEIWYTAKKSGNTSYYDVPIKNHKTAGVYNVHVYGNNGLLTATTFDISPIDFNNVVISDIDKEDLDGNGIYKVNLNVKDINSISGVDKVNVSVWTASNQNDKYTYQAQLEGDNYIASVNPNHHKYNSGKYHTKVTVIGKNGVSADKTVEDVGITLKIGARIVSSENSKTTIQIYNTSPSVKEVLVPTWSPIGSNDGHDDETWYEAKKQSDGSYLAVVKSSNHPPFDQNWQTQLVSHVYVDGSLATSLPLYTITNVHLGVPEIFRYSQKDGRWGSFNYGLGTLAGTGCMPTALAMIFSSIYNRYILPPEVASYLYYNTNEYNKIGPGTTGLSVVYAASHYGVSYKGLRTYSELKNALYNGQLVIGAVRNGSLNLVKSGYTHAVVMFGYDVNDDKTNVIDPLGFAKNGRYSVNEIFNQHSNDPDDLKAGGVAFHALY